MKHGNQPHADGEQGLVALDTVPPVVPPFVGRRRAPPAPGGKQSGALPYRSRDESARGRGGIGRRGARSSEEATSEPPAKNKKASNHKNKSTKSNILLQ